MASEAQKAEMTHLQIPKAWMPYLVGFAIASIPNAGVNFLAQDDTKSEVGKLRNEVDDLSKDIDKLKEALLDVSIQLRDCKSGS